MVPGMSTKKGTAGDDFLAEQFLLDFIGAAAAENQLEFPNIPLGGVQIWVLAVLLHADWFCKDKQPNVLAFVSLFDAFVIWRTGKGFPNKCPFDLHQRRPIEEAGGRILGMKRYGCKQTTDQRRTFENS